MRLRKSPLALALLTVTLAACQPKTAEAPQAPAAAAGAAAASADAAV
ncbi:MAG: BON domain-containing protein, partial [Lysobacter sp.]|nr:BON domain-containing protein [Lysobacter sp.]